VGRRWVLRVLRESFEGVGGVAGWVREALMKIITYNVRGFGGGEKRAEV